MFFGRKFQVKTLALALLGLLLPFAVTLAEPRFYVRKKLTPPPTTFPVSSGSDTAELDDVDLPRRIIPGLPPKAPGKSLSPLESAASSAWRIDAETRTVRPAPHTTYSKDKALVHFPEELQGASSQQKNQPQNAALYPKHYSPLLPPINAQQANWHHQAVAAYELGNSLGQQNRIDDAIDAYRSALKMAPDFADAYIGLSTTAIIKGQWETAFDSASKGLSLRKGFIDPDNITRGYYNLSATYCVMDRYSQAKKYYQKVQQANYPLAPQLWAYIQRNCKH